MDIGQTLLGTFTGGAAVTPNDGADLSRIARALYVGSTGNVKVTTVDGDVLTFSSVPVGILDIYVKRVWSTGTTASSIIALWK